MCGIAGIVSPAAPEPLRLRLEAMLHAQAHRGPDDCGLEILTAQQGFVALGNRRLV